MKIFLFIFLLSFIIPTKPYFIEDVDKLQLDPCPFSPNCVGSQENSVFKKMEPIYYDISRDSAAVRLERVLRNYPNAVFIENSEDYYRYEFKTSLGKFIDDVEFLINDEKKVIHFRSASRIGFGDFGKNRRRMKAIKKAWKAY